MLKLTPQERRLVLEFFVVFVLASAFISWIGGMS
jgi:hypothetical protein